MIPILYEKNETTFTHLGIGALSDAVSCKVPQQINGAFELVMQYPQDGIRFEDLKVERIIKAVAEYKRPYQLFSIYRITKPIKGIVTVYASHISSRKEFIPIMPCTANGVSAALTAISANVAEANPFTLWTNKTDLGEFKILEPVSLGQALGGMDGSVLDLFGGEFEFDNYTIKLWSQRGADNGVSLRYGKNITDFEQDENIAATITGICPFWRDYEGNTITLPEKTVDAASAPNFAFKRTVPVDFSGEFENQPTEAELRAKAQEYVTQEGIGVPEVGLKIRFVNLADTEEKAILETVHLGDTVHVYFEPLDVTATARVQKVVYNVLLDQYDSIDVGSVRTNMSDVLVRTQNTIRKSTENIVQNQSRLEAALMKALEDLSGADGGYIVIRQDANGKPYEILAMDTDDVSTATKVLRLNQNGLGYSQNGINGPYTAAITGDGITATAITTGTLDSIKIIADDGTIGGWTISGTRLTAANGTTYLSSALNDFALKTLYLVIGHNGDISTSGSINLSAASSVIQHDDGRFQFNIISVGNDTFTLGNYYYGFDVKPDSLGYMKIRINGVAYQLSVDSSGYLKGVQV